MSRDFAAGVKRIEAGPQDFNALNGIAAIDPARGGGRVGWNPSVGWAKIPTYYVDWTQRALPLTQAEFTAAFGGSIQLFNETEGQAGHYTSAETGSGVNEPFLAMGVGVVAIGEGKSFTLPGALMDIDRTAGEATIPQVDGCIADSESDGAQAALYWGGPTWNGIEAFFQRYHLQLNVNRRFQLVDETLSDVGMVPTPPEMVGASSSLIPGMPYVRRVNDVLASKTSFAGKVFLPQNIAGTVCVGAPTAAVTYGHPRIIGLSNRIFCFNQPIPILPGMRFDTNFVPISNDLAVGGYLDNMNREWVMDPTNPTLPDAAYASGQITNTNIFAGVYHVPGGTVTLGLVLKGYALTPRACLEYVVDYMAQGSALGNMVMSSSHVYLAGLLQNPALRGESKMLGKISGILQGMTK